MSNKKLWKLKLQLVKPNNKKPPSKFRKLLGKIDIYVLIMCVFCVFNYYEYCYGVAFKDIPMVFSMNL